MTEATISTIVVAICAALPPSILALASLRQGKANHRAAVVVSKQVAVNDKKTDSVAKQIELNDKKTDTLIEKTAEIHVLTNGSLHAVEAALQVANEKANGFEDKIKGLEAMLARVLGDEKVRLTVTEQASLPPAARLPDPTLKAIEANTKDTAANTAKAPA